MSDQPTKIGFVGTVIAVVGGGAIYHWLNSGSLSNAMMMAPTATSVGHGALVGGLGALALPNIPYIGPMITKLLSSLTGTGKKIRDAIPPQLITDILSILKSSGGKLSLADIEKLIADFEQIDPAIIMQIVRDAINAIRGDAPKGVQPDVEVIV